MKKTIIVIQLVLVCFLYNTSIYAQSKFDTLIIGLKDKDNIVRVNAARSLGSSYCAVRQAASKALNKIQVR